MQQYEQVLLLQWVALTKDGLHLTDVWESTEQFQRWAETKIGPSPPPLASRIRPLSRSARCTPTFCLGDARERPVGVTRSPVHEAQTGTSDSAPSFSHFNDPSRLMRPGRSVHSVPNYLCQPRNYPVETTCDGVAYWARSRAEADASAHSGRTAERAHDSCALSER